MENHSFTLTSTDIGGIATLKQAATDCGGENISPQLSWINAPKHTKSFAITIYDQSAPTGGGFWHWLVFDIPANIHSLPSNSGNPQLNLMPNDATQCRNDYGYYGYGGPCPPSGHGFHLYLITVYALDTERLGLGEDSMPNSVGFHLWTHTIEKASMVIYFKV